MWERHVVSRCPFCNEKKAVRRDLAGTNGHMDMAFSRRAGGWIRLGVALQFRGGFKRSFSCFFELDASSHP